MEFFIDNERTFNNQGLYLWVMNTMQPNKEALTELANTRMPFGRFKGKLLVELPEPYLVWYSQQGFPQGKLGELLAEMYEIKVNGLEQLIWPFVQKK